MMDLLSVLINHSLHDEVPNIENQARVIVNDVDVKLSLVSTILKVSNCTQIVQNQVAL